MSVIGSALPFFFASKARVIVLPAIGASFQGGFFAGTISHTANGVATHALIVAPRATGATGTGYIPSTNKQWKTSQTTTAGTTSDFNGVPARASNRTAGAPAQTSVAAFQTGGAEPFVADKHWSSTEFSALNGWNFNFLDGSQEYATTLKDLSFRVRAFRKLAL